MSRLLAIDYGQKRVGIAVTDEEQIIASALTTLHSKEVMSFLKDYLSLIYLTFSQHHLLKKSLGRSNVWLLIFSLFINISFSYLLLMGNLLIQH